VGIVSLVGAGLQVPVCGKGRTAHQPTIHHSDGEIDYARVTDLRKRWPPMDFDIWERIDLSIEKLGPPAPAAEPESAKEKPSPEEAALKKRRLKRTIRILDVIGLAFWTYAFFKLFVVDLDDAAVQRFAPWAVRFMGFRFLLWVLVLVVIAMIFKRKYILHIAYVLFFPLIVVVWKLPYLVYRRRSWTLALLILNVIVNGFRQARYQIISKGLALFATVTILATHAKVPLVIAALYLLGMQAIAIYRALKFLLFTEGFLETQTKIINRLSDSGRSNSAMALDEVFLNPEIEVYTKEQIEKFKTGLATRVWLNRGLLIYAYQLDNYRRRAVGMALSLVSFALLFLSTIATITLVNIAIYRYDPAQFDYAEAPTLLRMALYSMSSLAMNAGAGIEAEGDAAVGVRLAAGFVGVILLIGIGLNVVLSWRRERDEAEITAAVTKLKASAAAVEAQMRDDYRVGVDEAVARLQRIGMDVTQLMTFLMGSIPPEFFDDLASDNRDPA
jgi:hypothetical protein